MALKSEIQTLLIDEVWGEYTNSEERKQKAMEARKHWWEEERVRLHLYMTDLDDHVGFKL